MKQEKQEQRQRVEQKGARRGARREPRGPSPAPGAVADPAEGGDQPDGAEVLDAEGPRRDDAGVWRELDEPLPACGPPGPSLDLEAPGYFREEEAGPGDQGEERRRDE
ncbi:MAG: hypothetical protein AB7N76_29315 [Planctomycetota bacterium]